MLFKCLEFYINRLEDGFYDKQNDYKNSTSAGNGNFYGNCNCDLKSSGSTHRKKKPNVPPYLKYFEERDYDTIRTAGILSSEMKQEMVGDFEDKNQSSQQESSKQTKYETPSSRYRRSEDDYSENIPKKLKIYADIYLAEEKPKTSKPITCEKIIYDKPAVCCCSDSSKEKNYLNILLIPVVTQRNGYDKYRNDDYERKSLCSCNRKKH